MCKRFDFYQRGKTGFFSDVIPMDSILILAVFSSSLQEKDKRVTTISK